MRALSEGTASGRSAWKRRVEPSTGSTIDRPRPNRRHNLDLTRAGARRISRPMSSADHETDSDELDPDEPRTPMWLPLLGGGLFLLALLLFLATRSDEEPVAEDNADTTAQQAPAEPQPEPPPAARARNAQAPDDEGTAPQPGRPRVLRGP